ncbi:hypothetical protein MRX96_046307 [Rhipicephalus microplus]
MEGGPRHLPPEVRPPNTFTPSSNSSTSAEELLQSMYMDSSEDTDRTRDNSLGQAAYVLEVDDQVAEPSSLSDNEVVEDDHQRPPGSEADSMRVCHCKAHRTYRHQENFLKEKKPSRH